LLPTTPQSILRAIPWHGLDAESPARFEVQRVHRFSVGLVKLGNLVGIAYAAIIAGALS